MLEILEAGTGHGSLTIHLARAIHAANLHLPEAKDRVNLMEDDKQTPLILHSSTTTDRFDEEALAPSSPTIADDTLTNWGESRRDRHAIIHSLDISSRNLRQAKKLIRGFQRGQYANDVQFHASDVSAWIDQQIVLRGKINSQITDKAFLSHIILDLPSTHQHLEKAASVLHINGRLLVFCPSITQIISCIKEIKNKQLPLEPDQFLEVGDGIAGGREWDIRAVQPRAHLREEQGRKRVDAVESDTSMNDRRQGVLTVDEKDSVNEAKDEKAVTAAVEKEEGWKMVCRPKIRAVGTGGGFVGLWRKTRES